MLLLTASMSAVELSNTCMHDIKHMHGWLSNTCRRKEEYKDMSIPYTFNKMTFIDLSTAMLWQSGYPSSPILKQIK
jgi:hypothetical protein